MDGFGAGQRASGFFNGYTRKELKKIISRAQKDIVTAFQKALQSKPHPQDKYKHVFPAIAGLFRINGREVSLRIIKWIKGETRKALAAAPGFEERHCEPNPFHL